MYYRFINLIGRRYGYPGRYIMYYNLGLKYFEIIFVKSKSLIEFRILEIKRHYFYLKHFVYFNILNCT